MFASRDDNLQKISDLLDIYNMNFAFIIRNKCYPTINGTAKNNTELADY